MSDQDLTDKQSEQSTSSIKNVNSMRKRQPGMVNNEHKRSIRDIKRDNNNNKKNSGKPKFADDRKFASRRYKSAGKGKVLGVIGVIIAFIFLILIIGNFTHSAILSVETDSYLVNTDSIQLDLEAGDYSLQTLSVTDTRLLEAIDTEKVETKAEGTITVFNTTDATQRLVATTRFKTSEGQIYRTPKAITVPAKGQLEGVRVVADAAGESGNQNPDGRIHVPGLVGTELEGDIYAVSDSGFSGGFTGTRAIPDPELASLAVEDMQSSLTDSFTDLAALKLGEDKIILDVTSDITFTDEIAGESSTQAQVAVRASAEAAVINRSVLIRKLSDSTSDNVSYNDDLLLLNKDLIVFSLSDEGVLSFSATPSLGYELNTNEIINQIAGLSSDQVGQILKSSLAITDYELVISPFWRNSVPNKQDKITVLVKGQDNVVLPDVQSPASVIHQESESDLDESFNNSNDSEDEEQVIRTEVNN